MPPQPRAAKPRTPDVASGGRRRLLLVGAGAVAGAVVLVVVVVLAFGGGDAAAGNDAQAAQAALEDAGCTLQAVPAQANAGDHSDVRSPGETLEWNTTPPTSGPHYGESAVWGAYTEPLEQARVVHNLEHGGVYVQYGSDVPAATVEELRGFYDEHEAGTLLAPLPELRDRIALGAWVTEEDGIGESSDRGRGYLALCTSFDEDAFAAFFDAFQFKGPERFSPSSMLPGR